MFITVWYIWTDDHQGSFWMALLQDEWLHEQKNLFYQYWSTCLRGSGGHTHTYVHMITTAVADSHHCKSRKAPSGRWSKQKLNRKDERLTGCRSRYCTKMQTGRTSCCRCDRFLHCWWCSSSCTQVKYLEKYKWIMNAFILKLQKALKTWAL